MFNFNWLKKSSEDLPYVPNTEVLFDESNKNAISEEEYTHKPEKIVYSDKGIYKSNSKKNPWRAALIFSKNKNRGAKSETMYVHIGNYPTKEEAQIARYNFIENLK